MSLNSTDRVIKRIKIVEKIQAFEECGSRRSAAADAAATKASIKSRKIIQKIIMNTKNSSSKQSTTIAKEFL